MRIRFLLLIGFLTGLINNIHSQTTNWSTINDNSANISFLSPPNTNRFDTLSTRLYSGKIDTTQAVQVHIFNNAQFNTDETIFHEALIQESNDTLRAIARLMILSTNAELTSIQNVYSNGLRGIEISITYKTLQSNVPYHTFVRYFIENGKFISFTWTGKQSNLKIGITTKSDFFNSIQIH